MNIVGYKSPFKKSSPMKGVRVWPKGWDHPRYEKLTHAEKLGKKLKLKTKKQRDLWGEPKSPAKQNLPGLRHTDPKKHGEYKQPHVHGWADKGQGTDPTNEQLPTKVKRKYYRQAKRKNRKNK